MKLSLLILQLLLLLKLTGGTDAFSKRSIPKGLDVNIQQFTESPGLYYDNEGEAYLYNSEWRVVTYINLDDANRNFENIKAYAKMSANFCKRHAKQSWMNLTGCAISMKQSATHIAKLEGLKDLVTQLTSTENPSKQKRGLIDIIGRAAKLLFGTLDDEDAEFYTTKISTLEGEQLDLLKLSKEQITVVKSTLSSINNTINDISKNEQILATSLEKMKQHINHKNGEIKAMLTATSVKLAIEEHSRNLDRALHDCEEQYEILINGVVQGMKGILQPQIVTPRQIMQYLRESQSEMPKSVSIPVPLSTAFEPMLLRLIDIDVFIKDNYFVYVIRLPLTAHVPYNVYHVLPLPIKIKGTLNKFIFIQPEKDYLLLDKSKQNYARLKADDFKECKTINKNLRICRQHFPIQMTQVHEDCEAIMLQPIRNIPPSCSQRVIELTSTLWTQLDNNEWLFVAPKLDTLTILCPNSDPTDIEIDATGKLALGNGCKGYGSRILILANSIISKNNSNKDIIPDIALKYDCCETIEDSTKFNQLNLDIPLKNVVHQADDLRVASHKIEEVENLINEQEWKTLHSERVRNHSFLSYLGTALSCILCIFFICCCCCNCCKRKFPNFMKHCLDNNPCNKMVQKMYIYNSPRSSPIPRRSSRSRADVMDRMDVTELTELTELNEPTTTVPRSVRTASGKR